MATTSDIDYDTEKDGEEDSHSVWSHVVKALANAADATVDVAAIVGVTLMAIRGVDPATMQVVGGMVVSVALGKRYIERDTHDG